MRREWIEMNLQSIHKTNTKSPSMRREWIEILLIMQIMNVRNVSLHAEGVD